MPISQFFSELGENSKINISSILWVGKNWRVQLKQH